MLENSCVFNIIENYDFYSGFTVKKIFHNNIIVIIKLHFFVSY